MKFNSLCLGLVVWLLLILPLPEIKAQSNQPITPQQYQRMLGVGINVDWATFRKNIKYYNVQQVKDFKAIGFKHVRVRAKLNFTNQYLRHLDRVINDCLDNGLIPVLAQGAKDFNANPSPSNMDKLIRWWTMIARRYKNYSYLLSYDLIIEPSGQLRRSPQILNEFYQKVVDSIHTIDPYRIIFIKSRKRSSPEYLHELVIPDKANGYLMAEFHFYASGPSKKNPSKLWTTGTKAQKQLILRKIRIALDWSKKTGILLWVGAWMPGNYNKGDDYTIAEQKKFANFMTCALEKAHIPFAINADNQFYNPRTDTWRTDRLPVLETILHPHCRK